LAAKPGEPYYGTDAETVLGGKYPLARYLYVYVNQKPGAELDPLRREFIRFVFSQDGQASVIKDGYFPVNAKIAGEELSKLGLDVSSR